MIIYSSFHSLNVISIRQVKTMIGFTVTKLSKLLQFLKWKLMSILLWKNCVFTLLWVFGFFLFVFAHQIKVFLYFINAGKTHWIFFPLFTSFSVNCRDGCVEKSQQISRLWNGQPVWQQPWHVHTQFFLIQMLRLDVGFRTYFCSYIQWLSVMRLTVWIFAPKSSWTGVTSKVRNDTKRRP